jgi:hypothetical protein
MRTFMRRLFRRGPGQAPARRPAYRVRPAVEPLEERALLSIAGWGGDTVSTIDPLDPPPSAGPSDVIVLPPPETVPGHACGDKVRIELDKNNRQILITGTNHDDVVTVHEKTKVKKGQVVTVITVKGRTEGGAKFEEKFTVQPGELVQVVFWGCDGDDRFDNRTASLRAVAFGGDGDDRLQGGALGDALFGQGGTNRLEGRNGVDFYDVGAGGRIVDQDGKNFDAKRWTVDGMTYGDIVQGTSCSCWLLSALGAVAATRPGHLEKLIAYKGDGQYEVTLYDITQKAWVKEQIYFDGLTTDAEPGFRDPVKGQVEFWTVLFHRAYFQHYKLPPDCGGQEHPAPRTEAGALTTLTGQPAETHKLADDQSADKDATLKAIQKALADKRGVVVGTVVDRQPSTSLLVANHCYQVLAIHQSLCCGTVVELYNPWGFDTRDNKVVWGENDGVIVISWEDFVQSIGTYTLGSKPQ